MATSPQPPRGVAQAKSAMRADLRAALDGMSTSERAAASQAACSLLKQQDLWRRARTILFYAPLPNELDIWPLALESLAAGRTVLLPRFDPAQQRYVACHVRNADKDLQTGRFGIREPTDSCAQFPLKRLDLILVPGVAFDLDGHRLGRGKGFYDRLLAMLEGPACGVAFDQQIVERIPAEPHDVSLSCILTPTRWHFVAGHGRL